MTTSIHRSSIDSMRSYIICLAPAPSSRGLTAGPRLLLALPGLRGQATQ